MIWAFPVLLCLGVVAVLPFVIELRRPTVDTRRAKAPGQFAELGAGLTHYQWHGPADGPVMVCIHGLTTPGYVWDELVPGLTGAGFQVLTYDLYGRGFSDRPRGAQTREFFVRQLRELLDDQVVDDDITLFGYSMGGSIATVFAAAEPDRVARVLLLAPAGLTHAPGALAEAVRRLPGIGDWLMLAFGGWQLRRAAAQQDAPPAIRKKMAARQAAETRYAGYLPAVLSSQRNLLADALDAEHRALRDAGIPVAAIWGEADRVIPLRAMGRLAQNNRDARHAVIAGAGHGLGYTHAAEVIEEVARLLRAE